MKIRIEFEIDGDVVSQFAVNKIREIGDSISLSTNELTRAINSAQPKSITEVLMSKTLDDVIADLTAKEALNKAAAEALIAAYKAKLAEIPNLIKAAVDAAIKQHGLSPEQLAAFTKIGDDIAAETAAEIAALGTNPAPSPVVPDPQGV